MQFGDGVGDVVVALDRRDAAKPVVDGSRSECLDGRRVHPGPEVGADLALEAARVGVDLLGDALEDGPKQALVAFVDLLPCTPRPVLGRNRVGVDPAAIHEAVEVVDRIDRRVGVGGVEDGIVGGDGDAVGHAGLQVRVCAGR